MAPGTHRRTRGTQWSTCQQALLGDTQDRYGNALLGRENAPGLVHKWQQVM